MNHNVLNPCLLNSDYLSNSIPRTIRNKKSRKKKRKSKYKHFASKYKFSKKNNSSNFSGSKNYINYKFFKTSTAQNSWKAMSEWYWSNYKKAIEWQDKHKIAHWKACALALQEENRCLLQIINCLKPKFSFDLPVTMQDLNKDVDAFAKSNMKNCNNVKQENCSSNQEDFEEEYEFEISEEMMQFFETSFKHKLNLEKMKEEKQLIEVENSVKKIQSSRIKRIQEMQLLYGEAASMIIGMETAVQLSFDKFCDTKSPKFWPNIPLRL